MHDHLEEEIALLRENRLQTIRKQILAVVVCDTDRADRRQLFGFVFDRTVPVWLYFLPQRRESA